MAAFYSVTREESFRIQRETVNRAPGVAAATEYLGKHSRSFETIFFGWLARRLAALCGGRHG